MLLMLIFLRQDMRGDFFSSCLRIWNDLPAGVTSVDLFSRCLHSISAWKLIYFRNNSQLVPGYYV